MERLSAGPFSQNFGPFRIPRLFQQPDGYLDAALFAALFATLFAALFATLFAALFGGVYFFLAT